MKVLEMLTCAAGPAGVRAPGAKLRVGQDIDAATAEAFVAAGAAKVIQDKAEAEKAAQEAAEAAAGAQETGEDEVAAVEPRAETAVSRKPQKRKSSLE